MSFRKWVKYIRESVKQDELDRILDKIYRKEKLNDIEKKFLDKFDKTSEEDYQDFRFLTKNDAYNHIKNIMDKGRKIVCDLRDRDGKIGVEIKKIKNDFENDICKLKLANNEIVVLKDNFLYDILYNPKNDTYVLQEQDEYYEKIPVKDEN